ncbi:MAG: hypothetical protein Fur0043_00760 [Anaerolineales bacterium]
MKAEILVATNGYEVTWPAIEYAAWLAEIMDTSLILIGFIERGARPNIDAETHPLDNIFSRAVALFDEKRLLYRLEVIEGQVEDVLPQKVREKNFLTVLSPLGRPPLRRLLLGRSFRQLMADISGPLIYVPAACIPPGRILICLGGLGYGLRAESLGLQIAGRLKVPVTLLHVVPPIDLDYPEARTVRENWDHLLDTNTLLGRTLRHALNIAQQSGLEAAMKVRHGNVVEEILAELNERQYGLVCMGSPYSAHGLRQLYAPNVTAEVAEIAGCPVLTVRYEAQEAAS